jgi:hypothetical protein
MPERGRENVIAFDDSGEQGRAFALSADPGPSVHFEPRDLEQVVRKLYSLRDFFIKRLKFSARPNRLKARSEYPLPHDCSRQHDAREKSRPVDVAQRHPG